MTGYWHSISSVNESIFNLGVDTTYLVMYRCVLFFFKFVCGPSKVFQKTLKKLVWSPCFCILSVRATW